MAAILPPQFFRLLSLQEAKDPIVLKRCLHTLVSLWTISWMIYGSAIVAIYYDPEDSNEYIQHGQKYTPYLLSFWVAAAQYVYFTMYSVIDILELYWKDNNAVTKYTSVIHKIASYLLFTIVFPTSLCVLCVFWTLFFWDRNIVYPDLLDVYFPIWLNHAMHTYPVPLSIIYMLTSNKDEPPKHATFAGLVAFLSAYTFVFFFIQYRDGTYVYYGLHLLKPTHIQFIGSIAIVITILFYFLGYKLNSILKWFKKNSKYAQL